MHRFLGHQYWGGDWSLQERSDQFQVIQQVNDKASLLEVKVHPCHSQSRFWQQTRPFSLLGDSPSPIYCVTPLCISS